MSVTTLAPGRIVKVAGPVVDVEFPAGALPEINFALQIDLEIQGSATTIICEVCSWAFFC